MAGNFEYEAVQKRGDTPKGTKRKAKVPRLETEEQLKRKLLRGFKRERLKDIRALCEALHSSN